MSIIKIAEQIKDLDKVEKIRKMLCKRLIKTRIETSSFIQYNMDKT